MEELKLVIDVIDNGGQWTHREWRMLRYLGVDTKIVPNDTPLSDLRKVDGLILSGGAASCLLYTSPSPRDGLLSRMPSSA